MQDQLEEAQHAAREAELALKAERARHLEFKRMSLTRTIALVRAAGGSITVLPDHLIDLHDMELRTREDLEASGVVYEVIGKRKAPSRSRPQSQLPGR